MGAGFGPGQFVFRAADHDFFPVLDIPVNHLAHGKHFGFSAHQRQHNHAEGGFKRGVLEELIQDDLGVAFALDFNHKADAVAVGLVPNV